MEPIEKYELIEKACLENKSCNPIVIAEDIMAKDFISMHGPEHHFLDGASFLTAYHNAGGKIDLVKAFATLKKRAATMPGAMCGYWGVCGSTTSLGAALAIIHETGPLSDDQFYKDHMEYTSKVIALMAKIGGPRCCKRNAFLSISNAVSFVNSHYDVKMEISPIVCNFDSKNDTCIKQRCPFYRKNK